MTATAIQGVRADRSRLSITALLMWMLGVAIGIRAYQALLPEVQDKFDGFAQGYVAAMGLALGTMVAGAGLIAWRRLHGGELPRLPGHWLLLIGVAAAAANVVALTCFQLLAGRPDASQEAIAGSFWSQFNLHWSAHSAEIECQAIAWVLGFAAMLFVFRRLGRRVSSRWALAFSLFVISSAVLFAGYALALGGVYIQTGNAEIDSWLYWLPRWWCSWSGHIFLGLVALCASGVLLCAAIDLRRRSPTDWLHWTGIAAWVLIGATQAATFAVLHLTP